MKNYFFMFVLCASSLVPTSGFCMEQEEYQTYKILTLPRNCEGLPVLVDAKEPSPDSRLVTSKIFLNDEHEIFDSVNRVVILNLFLKTEKSVFYLGQLKPLSTMRRGIDLADEYALKKYELEQLEMPNAKEHVFTKNSYLPKNVTTGTFFIAHNHGGLVPKCHFKAALVENEKGKNVVTFPSEASTIEHHIKFFMEYKNVNQRPIPKVEFFLSLKDSQPTEK